MFRDGGAPDSLVPREAQEVLAVVAELARRIKERQRREAERSIKREPPKKEPTVAQPPALSSPDG